MTATDRWLRRHAVQLSGQLPEDAEEARRVIGYMQELLNGFLAPEPGPERTEPLKFVAHSGRRNRPMPS